MSGATTALMIGFTALQAVGSIQQSKAQAKAAIAEGNIAAQNKAKETQIKAARLQSSFLSSGLTLEGTPQNVIDDTFNVGLTDLGQIKSNYDNKAKSIISAGRTEALGKLASGFSGMGWSGGGSSVNSVVTTAGSYLPDSFAYGLNSAGYGNMAYDMLEKSDIRNGYY
jgi:hypothetical protein